MRQRAFLHIAQKNSIAKSVADILSKGTKRTGITMSKYNPVYEFKLDQDNHTFSSVRGHIFDYQLPEYCKSWANFDNKKILTREVPMVKKLQPDMQDLNNNLEKLARNKDQLILWLDCDREGEAIAYQVIQIITRINPHLRIRRARFAAVTKTDIQHAYNNLVDPNPFEADAVNYRIEIDFRMGCAFTRYQTTTFHRHIYKQNSVISYGPCQMPTLGFVVNRYLQIKNFRPQKYWFITAKAILDENTVVAFKWERKNTRDEVEAHRLFASMYLNGVNNEINQGRLLGKIRERNKNERKRYRPYPLTTVKFQKLATDKLKMSSAQAMKTAENLYQRGYISYPRTQTNAFPQTMNLQSMVKKLEGCSTFLPYINKLFNNNKFQKPKVGNQNDQAHTPIHPVKAIDRGQLTNNEWRVYDLITRHFLACCSKDALGIESEIIADIGGQVFRATHLSIKQKNYLQIYPFQKWTESQFPGQIPNIFPASAALDESVTQPPAYLSEADLIDLMEKNQIGTDATIHEHIETIQNRKYAVKANNRLRPTNLGASLIVTYRNLGINLSQCDIRRMIEEKMNDISANRIRKEEATLQTLTNVIPIYERLKSISNDWMNTMNQSMNQHQNLNSVPFQSNNPNTNNSNLANGNNQNRNNQNRNNGEVVCYKCRQPGHIAPNCPNGGNNNNHQSNPTSRVNNNRQRYNSNTNQHSASTWKNKKNSQDKKDNNNNNTKVITCYRCKEQGHIAPNCPNKGSNYSPPKGQAKTKEVTCFKCGKVGHIAPNCPEKGQKSSFNNINKNNYSSEKEIKKVKKCKQCGNEGRHPKFSNCSTLKRNKSTQNSNNNNYEYDD